MIDNSHYVNISTNVNRSEIGSASQYLIVMTPSKDNKLYTDNFAALQWVAINLNRKLLIITSDKPGICAGRTHCLRIAKDYFNVNSIRVLWLDSDILITNMQSVLIAINYADSTNTNFAANYHRGAPPIVDNTLYPLRSDGRFDIAYTDRELAALDNFARIDYSGLGFVYTWTPLDYEFVTDRVGEDFHFFIDNKIELRYAKDIILKHKQDVFV